ncbi:MAG: T9SS type A sorting domain-containing protein [Candidatus Zixiibacteriota bacterium]
MSNGEIDYDQVYAAINKGAEGWAPPHSDATFARDMADGQDVECILSYGPIADIAPGDSVPFTVAFVAGADFHRDPQHFELTFDPDDPSAYMAGLNFDNLIKNARWADWVFDNPGVDTDGDGYRGRAYLVNCDGAGNCDSIFYKGDGIPDWKGPSAPPPPRFEMTTYPGELVLRWNGEFSETVTDAFSLRHDFEGYRLSMGRFDLDDQYSLVTSWDIEDFKRLEYVTEGSPSTGITRRWRVISYPFPPDEWPELLGDPEFNVYDWLTQDPDYAYRDTITDTTYNVAGEIVRIAARERLSIWTAEAFNRGNEYDEAGYREYNVIQRVGERDTVVDGVTMTYGVYEARLENLNPAVPMYVAITAFDYGDYLRDFDPLESSQSANSQYAHFIYTPDIVMDSGLGVSVYPNPYKVVYTAADGERTTYYREGYEGLGIEKFKEQDRRIWFVNLPEKATIRIFSLDGDLIRTINHPDPFLTKYPSAVGWDLVSRNIQAVTSGIYIWRVDSELGTQTGKLVIIK